MPAKKPTSKDMPKVAKTVRVRDLDPSKDTKAKVRGGAIRSSDPELIP